MTVLSPGVCFTETRMWYRTQTKCSKLGAIIIILLLSDPSFPSQLTPLEGTSYKQPSKLSPVKSFNPFCQSPPLPKGM